MVELVDTQDLKSCSLGSPGSIPGLGTILQTKVEVTTVTWNNKNFNLQQSDHVKNKTIKSWEKEYAFFQNCSH
jgi:hypothetical protein